MKSIRQNIWLWVLCAWIGLIFFSSTSLAEHVSENAFSFLSNFLLPRLPRDSSSYGAIHLLADKGVHVTLFAVLGMLLWKVLPGSKRKFAIALGIGAIVGSCSEILQSFFPDRDPAIRDVMINICGTAFGIGLSLAFRRLVERHVVATPSRMPQKIGRE